MTYNKIDFEDLKIGDVFTHDVNDKHHYKVIEIVITGNKINKWCYSFVDGKLGNYRKLWYRPMISI